MKNKTPWIIAGGKIGELGWCQRCGEGLSLGTPIRVEVAVAAMNAFVKAHSSCRETGYREPVPETPEEWIQGRDTGISSATIWSVMMGHPSPYQRYDVPHDSDDLGRCRRLLVLFPEWRTRLTEVADRYPSWLRFVAKLEATL